MTTEALLLRVVIHGVQRPEPGCPVLLLPLLLVLLHLLFL